MVDTVDNIKGSYKIQCLLSKFREMLGCWLARLVQDSAYSFSYATSGGDEERQRTVLTAGAEPENQGTTPVEDCSESYIAKS